MLPLTASSSTPPCHTTSTTLSSPTQLSSSLFVIIISYPPPHYHSTFIQPTDLLRSWNSCFSRLEVPHFGRERPTLVHMHVPPPTSDARRPDFPILADSQTRSIGPLSSSLTFHSQLRAFSIPFLSENLPSTLNQCWR